MMDHPLLMRTFLLRTAKSSKKELREMVAIGDPATR